MNGKNVALAQNKKILSINYAIWLARLTNSELLILRLWMEGYTNKDIAFISGLKVSQPAISKRLRAIRDRVKRAYFEMEELCRPNGNHNK